MKKIVFISLVIGAISFNACKKDDDSKTTPTPTTTNKGGDPNFTVVSNGDGILPSFSKKVDVFGIPIYAVSGVEDVRLLHAANVMAQYLDNNEDGIIDNQKVLDAMLANKAYMVMWKSEDDLNINPPEDRMGQDLGNDETQPSFVSGGKTGQFDASLEEVWHIITNAGYAQVYPNVLGTDAGTQLSIAMDTARGGYFENIPNPYPSDAWYTYDDPTCDYECMSSEYIYWGMTSILGAQENRLNEIDNEWRLNTKEKVQQTDQLVYALLTDPQYTFPTVLPDGTYKR